jgi:hypothetical protein
MWIPLVENDLSGALTSPEIKLFNTSLLATGSPWTSIGVYTGSAPASVVTYAGATWICVKYVLGDPPGVTPGNWVLAIADRLASIVTWVISLVRGKIAAWPENLNKMGPSGTIAEEVYGDAVEIARFKLLTSFPGGKMFIDDARLEGFRVANKHLDDAANGKLVIEPAPSTTETGAQFDTSKIAYGSVTSDRCNPTLRSDPTVPDRFDFWH